MIDLFLDRYVYVFVLVLLSIGLYGMLAKTDLVKKIVGMTIFQTAIYIFFIQGSLQEGGTVPILADAYGADPAGYVDPLPHLLILTAIVVGVGVLGVALALLVRIHRTHDTFDEAIVAANLAGTDDLEPPVSHAHVPETPSDDDPDPLPDDVIAQRDNDHRGNEQHDDKQHGDNDSGGAR
ncbi:MAG: cation:proton antiporter subunit C [Nitriliruptoraceae bacterium]